MSSLLKHIKTKKWIIFISLFLCFLFTDLVFGFIYYYCGGDIYHLTTIQTVYFLLGKYFILIMLFIP